MRFDNNLVWQSYAQMKYADFPLLVKKTRNTKIILEDDREIIDGISSWWTICHGHSNEYIISKIESQLRNAAHIMFAGLAHPSSYELAEKLKMILPNGLNHFIYCESGSIAVEISLKLALQYFKSKKTKIIYFENSYHGDSMACSVISDDDNSPYNFAKIKLDWQKVKLPSNLKELNDFEQFIRSQAEFIAAIIIEPILQAGGGMKFHEPEILAKIYYIVKKYDIIFIADEIATGFYRTGKYFACNHANITPDIICLGKAISSGTIPFAAVSVTSEIFEKFYSEDPSYIFKYGTTYAANPLGCVASIASIELFEKEDYEKKIIQISEQFADELSILKNHEKVRRIDIMGAITAIELDCDYESIIKMRSIIRSSPVWLRPFKNVIYSMPPFTISSEEISIISENIIKLISEI